MIKKFFLNSSLFATLMFADTIKVGEEIKPFILPDQFGTQHSVNSKEYSMIVISGEKQLSAKMKDFLQLKHRNFLEEHNTLYISDIHSMPSFVTNFFALPKMQEYKFLLLLIYNEEQNIFPMKNDQLTIIKLQDTKVSSITFENNVTKIFY